ncbi:MAG TPA: TonB-dependent receptor [Ferruginibacter sp.]|nr:TonB-dependent receptor [Ferruginibacter sp.]HRO16799.1 TonB-dependent receptor [Ferruginibacter sp.]HRQ20335.1 TonB-dependent receptor [Ferruginibacter sp.]
MKYLLYLLLGIALLPMIGMAQHMKDTIPPVKDSVKNIEDVVITGTMKPVRKLESPIPVEVYGQTFLKSNPTPSVFEALQNINGVRPQLNCNVCNTGDIHINGLEGPYTLVMIDGMPIVSSLASVYGLTGIPNALVDRIEVIKGPASALYGSEAVGGIIHVITKHPNKAPRIHAETMGTSWGEFNADISVASRRGKVGVLQGMSYFQYSQPIDRNNDNFTDVTLQQRISVFQKWNIARRHADKLLQWYARYMYEDRWGGEMQWNKKHRGGDEMYGESIYTNRLELTGMYDLPRIKNLRLSTSFALHRQNSFYGTTSFNATQSTSFTQLTWMGGNARHQWLTGAALRFQYYKDNTPVEASANYQRRVWLPGAFVQHEFQFHPQHTLLTGLRFDYHSVHHGILTPRLAYKWKPNSMHLVRFNAGTGYRVVNLFTEDHAALTGARKVVIENALKPERSLNVNLNYMKQFLLWGGQGSFDITGWVTRFFNRITADYESDPNLILYNNLSQHTTGKGITINADYSGAKQLRINLGVTMQHIPDATGRQQMLTERTGGTWLVSFPIGNKGFSFDYTGNIYGRMRVPLLGPLDPRSPYAPVWSTQNIQCTYQRHAQFSIFAGVKNLLNFTPARHAPFIIARAHDPFDRNVQFDGNGQALATPENPYALTFDPNYVYAPNQGIRVFAGIRWRSKK